MKLSGAFSTSRGITLIEVLVTVVVLAFGMLGLAGLQAHSLRNNQSAYFRSQATYIAYETIDRMRANRTEALAGRYDLANKTASYDASASQLTSDDLDDWVAYLNTTTILPTGNGSIDCTTTAGVCTVTVTWDDTRGAAAAQSFTMSTEI